MSHNNHEPALFVIIMLGSLSLAFSIVSLLLEDLSARIREFVPDGWPQL